MGKKLPNLSNDQIAFECILKFTEKDIDKVSLRKIISETINFKFPSKKLSNDISVLEFFMDQQWRLRMSVQDLPLEF